MDKIPLLKRATLTEVIHVRVDKDLAKDLRELRSIHGLDSGELVRAFLKSELPKIKKRLITA